MCTAYGIEVEKTKQYIGGLSLASTGVFGHFILFSFICTIISALRVSGKRLFF